MSPASLSGCPAADRSGSEGRCVTAAGTQALGRRGGRPRRSQPTLTRVKEARRAVASCFGIVGAAAAVFIGVIANRTSSPWKNSWFLLWVVVLGACIGLAVVATLPDISEWLGIPVKRMRGSGRQPRPYLERWLYTSEGLRSPAHMSVLETTLPGTGYRKMPGERLPWARFVILIACSPPPNTRTG